MDFGAEKRVFEAGLECGDKDGKTDIPDGVSRSLDLDP
jgi:hypothetical protein